MNSCGVLTISLQQFASFYEYLRLHFVTLLVFLFAYPIYLFVELAGLNNKSLTKFIENIGNKIDKSARQKCKLIDVVVKFLLTKLNFVWRLKVFLKQISGIS